MPACWPPGREQANYFEKVVSIAGDAKLAANWVMVELGSLLNKQGLEIDEAPVTAEQLGGMLLRIKDNTISGKIAKTVFEAMAAGEGNADEIIEKRGLKQVTDSGAISAVLDEMLAGQCRAGRAIPRGRRSQARQDVRLLCRPGDESLQGQSQPATGERTAQKQARRLIHDRSHALRGNVSRDAPRPLL